MEKNYVIAISENGRHFMGNCEHWDEEFAIYLENPLEFQIVTNIQNQIAHKEYKFYYYADPVLFIDANNEVSIQQINNTDMMVIIDLEDLHIKTRENIIKAYEIALASFKPRFAEDEEVKKAQETAIDNEAPSDPAEPPSNVINFSTIPNKRKTPDK